MVCELCARRRGHNVCMVAVCNTVCTCAGGILWGAVCINFRTYRSLPNNRYLIKGSMFARHLVERVWLINRYLATAVVFSLKASIFSLKASILKLHLDV